MDLSAYLTRIGYSDDVRPDLATLRALHSAHLRAIPYENLDVQLGRPLTTSPEAAYRKIVEQGRGGWCYEMNGLFGWALTQAGFQVTRLAARGGEPASHLVLRVDLDEPWIADVGYSDGPHAPFRPVLGPFEDRGMAFEIAAFEGGFRLNNHRFGMSKFYECGGPDEAAMADRCLWLQTAPESPFVLNAVLSRHTEAGYVTLVGRVLREIAPEGVVSTNLVADAAEYVTTLKARFGLDVPEAADLWPRICARHEVVMQERAAAKAAAAATADA